MARLALSVRSQFRGICEAFASLVFPAPCRICARMLDTGAVVPFCHACVKELTQKLPEPLCSRCGRPIVSLAVTDATSSPLCHLCRRGAYDFDLVRSFGAYTPSMARSILMLKYGEVTPLGVWFAKLLARLVEREPNPFVADVVVPVPLHPSRLRERGYNQAELIARPPGPDFAYPISLLSIGANTPPARQTSAYSARALGDGSWRLCHTRGCPS